MFLLKKHTGRADSTDAKMSCIGIRWDIFFSFWNILALHQVYRWLTSFNSFLFHWGCLSIYSRLNSIHLFLHKQVKIMCQHNDETVEKIITSKEMVQPVIYNLKKILNQIATFGWEVIGNVFRRLFATICNLHHTNEPLVAYISFKLDAKRWCRFKTIFKTTIKFQ